MRGSLSSLSLHGPPPGGSATVPGDSAGRGWGEQSPFSAVSRPRLPLLAALRPSARASPRPHLRRVGGAGAERSQVDFQPQLGGGVSTEERLLSLVMRGAKGEAVSGLGAATRPLNFPCPRGQLLGTAAPVRLAGLGGSHPNVLGSPRGY